MVAARSSAPATSATRSDRRRADSLALQPEYPMKYISSLGAAFGRLRVGQQLFTAFFAVLALTAVIGVSALFGLRQVDQEALALNAKWLQGVGHIAAFRAAAVESRDFEMKHSRATD